MSKQVYVHCIHAHVCKYMMQYHSNNTGLILLNKISTNRTSSIVFDTEHLICCHNICGYSQKS